jgi:enamine deaminase RidA (YjgF/YER057c/UK114 family)
VDTSGLPSEDYYFGINRCTFHHTAEFSEVLPVTAMVEVNRLIDPKILVEIEAEAVVADKS